MYADLFFFLRFCVHFSCAVSQCIIIFGVYFVKFPWHFWLITSRDIFCVSLILSHKIRVVCANFARAPLVCSLNLIIIIITVVIVREWFVLNFIYSDSLFLSLYNLYICKQNEQEKNYSVKGYSVRVCIFRAGFGVSAFCGKEKHDKCVVPFSVPCALFLLQFFFFSLCEIFMVVFVIYSID